MGCMGELTGRRKRAEDLLHQGRVGFEAWFGIRPEVTPVLRKTIEATL